MTAFLGFFRDCRRVVRDKPALGSLLALAAFQALTTAWAALLLGRLNPVTGDLTALIPPL